MLGRVLMESFGWLEKGLKGWDLGLGGGGCTTRRRWSRGGGVEEGGEGGLIFLKCLRPYE